MASWTDPRTQVVYDIVQLPLASIGLPEPYIRKEMNGQRVNLWIARLKGGDHPDDHVPADQWAGRWFLPPIKVMRLEKPVTVGKGDKQRTIDYRIIDGVHRYMTALGINAETMAAVVEEPMPASLAYSMQFRDNNEGPLPFDREGRDFYIRTARKVGVPLSVIAADTGLTETSVSRIARTKQGQTKAAVSASRKRGAAKRTAKPRRARRTAASSQTLGGHATDGWEPAQFFNACHDFSRQAKARRKALTAHLQARDSDWTKAQELINALTALRA